MANSAQAKKRIRQAARRTEVNGRRLGTVRTFIRKVEEAIASGNKADAETALRAAQPHMMRGAQKNVMHRNTVTRKISRLSRQIKKMAAWSPLTTDFFSRAPIQACGFFVSEIV